jgi:hypothetical protein
MLEKEYDLIKQIGQTIPTSLSITDIDDVSMYANFGIKSVPHRQRNDRLEYPDLAKAQGQLFKDNRQRLKEEILRALGFFKTNNLSAKS